MPPQQPGVWVGIDLGGTNAKAAAISDDGTVLSSHAIPHDGDLDSEHVIRRLHQCAEAAIEEIGVAWDEVLGVGVGAPGSIEDGVVTGASNFPSWRDVPLQDSLCKLCGGRPTTLANDADAAAAAELWVGAAAAGGFEDMVFVTLGTGVGVGVILGGEVVRGATGTIEGGHHIVQAVGGRPCPCGQSGWSPRCRYHTVLRILSQTTG
jgi:glucokinase|eukprot:COSAG02_NODE_17_length_55377_cov_106.402258_15_plen_207_part_00